MWKRKRSPEPATDTSLPRDLRPSPATPLERTRVRHDGDLAWGDEGIDDPPRST